MWFRHNGQELEVTRGTAEHEQLVKLGAEEISGPGEQATEDVPLARRTVAELRALAEELGVELEDGAKKAQIVEALEAAPAAGDEGDLDGGELEGDTLAD